MCNTEVKKPSSVGARSDDVLPGRAVCGSEGAGLGNLRLVRVQPSANGGAKPGMNLTPDRGPGTAIHTGGFHTGGAAVTGSGRRRLLLASADPDSAA